MKTRCRMNIAWFPFDEQICFIIFGSWSYTSNYLNYTIMHENPTLKNFTDNQEWTLVSYKPIRYEIKYEHWFDNESFSEIKYKILINRKPLFVLQNYVIPAVVLGTVTLVSFFIPFPQAMQMGISILLSFAVFKLRLSDDVPVQSDSIPLINVYFTLCITFSLASMIWFSLINNFRENNNLPNFIRLILLSSLSDRDKQLQNEIMLSYGKGIMKFKNGSFRVSFQNNINNNNNNNNDNNNKRSDKYLIIILNKFMFYTFLVMFFSLNVCCLFVFPFYFKKSVDNDSNN